MRESFIFRQLEILIPADAIDLDLTGTIDIIPEEIHRWYEEGRLRCLSLAGVRRLSGGTEEVHAQGKADSLRPAVHLELGEDVLEVIFYGMTADRQSLGDPCRA